MRVASDGQLAQARVATPARHIDREKAANFAQALCPVTPDEKTAFSTCVTHFLNLGDTPQWGRSGTDEGQKGEGQKQRDTSHSLKVVVSLCFHSGTGSQTRTDKVLPPADFESAASTNSTIPA